MRQHARGIPSRALAAAGILGIAVVLSAADTLADTPAAQAATTVTVGSADELVAAVAAANAAPGEDVILLDAPSDQAWTMAGAIEVTDDLRIQPAPGAGTVTVRSTDGSAFELGAGVSFTGTGFGATGQGGSGIDALAGADLVLTDVVLAGSAQAGLDQAGGTLTATRVTAQADGVAGIRTRDMDRVVLDHVTATGNPIGIRLETSGGTATVSASTISDNGAPGASPRGGLVVSATDAADVSIDATTISGNQATAGGGLRIEALQGGSQLVVRDSEISGNSAGYGGGIATVDPRSGFAIDGDSAVRIEQTVIDGNQASDTGGGIAITALPDQSMLSVTRSTVSGNSAFIGGGAAISFIHNGTDPAVRIDASTFSGNTARNPFGALMLECDDDPGPGTADIVDSTFSGNSATLLASAIGAGCDQPDGLLVRLRNSTITANSGDALAAVAFVDAAAQLRNSVLGANAHDDVDAADAASLAIDYSLVEAPDPVAATAMASGAGNVHAAPALSPLASNGGPTLTHLPLAGGNLVDAGDPAFIAPPATDQRGLARVAGRLDLGAVELAATQPGGDPDPGDGYGQPGGHPEPTGSITALPATGSAPPVAPGLPAAAIVLGILLAVGAAVRRRDTPRRN